MSDAAVATETTQTPAQEAVKQPTTKPGKAEEKPHYHVNEFKAGKRDPFTAAFNEAQDEIRGVEDEEPKPKAKKAPEPVKKEAEAEPKAKKEPEKQPEPKPEAKPEPDEDAIAAKVAAKLAEDKPEKQEKGPLEPKKWWSSRKRDAFQRMPVHIQEQWLSEKPSPDQRWTTEQKAAFEKLPPEAQELVLERHQEFERGFGEKFEGLAKERKLAEDIRKAIPPQLRTLMDQRGLSEAQVLNKLAQQQLHALQDPRGFVRKFLAEANINPLELVQTDTEGRPVAQRPQPQPAPDIRAHPEYQAMAAELQQLRQERQALAETEDQRFDADFQQLLGERDGEGNSLYPFIRVLAAPMAMIIENDPDRFAGLSLRDRLAASYYQALEDFPELTAIQMTAPKPKADEPKAEKADSDGEDERVAKLEKAVTPKSRAPALAPAGGATGGDPFEKAWESAKKALRK
jgi:hypothetical protein